MLAKYKICQRLSEGSFGQVYRGEHLRTQEAVAIKVERVVPPDTAETSLAETPPSIIKHECKILYYLRDRGCLNVPEVIWWGKFETPDDHVTFRAMILPLFESTLSTMIASVISATLERDKMNSLISHWVTEMVRILQQVHDAGIVHRDIKPQNFMLRNGVLYLIDFGLASVYVDEELHRHLPAKPVASHLLGTPKYVSVNVHEGIDPSRRDDMISVGYVWLFLLLGGRLPWDVFTPTDSVPCSADHNPPQHHILHPVNQDRKSKKLNFHQEPTVLTDYFALLHGIDFDDRPDYPTLIRTILTYTPSNTSV